MKKTTMETGAFSGKSIAQIEETADDLSLQNQKKYILCLKLLAISGTTMVGALLLYDDFGMSRLIFVYAALLLFGGFILGRAKKNNYHENYIKYRLLAEVLRVQKVLDSAGIMKNAADYFSFTMQDETTWIRKIIESAEHEYTVIAAGELKRFWLENQYNYHIAAEKKIRNKAKYNKRVADIVNVIVAVTVVMVCFVECISLTDIQTGIVTGVKRELAVITGVLSAVSVFLSSYYGKQNLERKIKDHTAMSRLYKMVLDKTENSPLTTEIIDDTAREEILENGNWYSYMKENKLSLKI